MTSMRKWFGFGILLLWLLTACAAKPGISIEDAWVRPDPMMENAAGYMTIRNDGNADDALTGVQAEFAKMASAHETVMSGAMHRMEVVPHLDIPAGETVVFQPLSYHIMLMGLHAPLEYGQTVNLTLEFEKSGQIVAAAEVRRE
tara:strand:+ start:435 stop:866 length:432 start_codon:yes stop_codon:yes gene_type:complete